MKQARFLIAVTCMLWIILSANAATNVASPTQKPLEKQAIIDVAFCLDTTGSMSGLIEGAKAKIWSIVNTVSTAKPKPVLRIALVGYRDLNDTYVTKTFDFTQDMEVMYSRLRDFHADGGGDEPEHVNQALHESIHKLSWSKHPGALKILYLVGDAPPHVDYQDEYDYRKVARRAAATGIIINTIQCGNAASTQRYWTEIARMAEGKYAAIDPSGGMVHVTSPYDDEMARLSTELNKTYVAYGKSGVAQRRTQEENDHRVAADAPAAAAERASVKASPIYKNESWDLVDAVQQNKVKVADLSKEDLPAEMRDLTDKEKSEVLTKKQQERTELQSQIQNLEKRRQSYLQEQEKKSGAKKDAFDVQVLSTLKEQSKSKGIVIE